MCVCACLYIEPVSRSKRLCRVSNKNWFCRVPVHTYVAECAWNGGCICHWGHPFWGCTFGGVYIPCIYSHTRWSYRRLFRSLLLCPLSVERYYFPLFVESLLMFTRFLGHLYSSSIGRRASLLTYRRFRQVYKDHTQINAIFDSFFLNLSLCKKHVHGTAYCVLVQKHHVVQV